MKATIVKQDDEMVLIEWSDKKLGFGRLDLIYNGDGTFKLDAEAMKIQTVISILKAAKEPKKRKPREPERLIGITQTPESYMPPDWDSLK